MWRAAQSSQWSVRARRQSHLFQCARHLISARARHDLHQWVIVDHQIWTTTTKNSTGLIHTLTTHINYFRTAHATNSSSATLSLDRSEVVDKLTQQAIILCSMCVLALCSLWWMLSIGWWELIDNDVMCRWLALSNRLLTPRARLRGRVHMGHSVREAGNAHTQEHLLGHHQTGHRLVRRLQDGRAQLSANQVTL